MSHGMRVMAVVLLAGVAGSGVWAAQRGAGPGQAGPSAGLIVGRVVDAGSGEPVAEAQITLAVRSDVAGGQPVRLLTGSDGRFVVRDVPLGVAQLSVTAPGYLSATHGQTRPGGPPQPLQITADKRVVQATLRVWKYAAVSGVVTDDTNAPAVNIAVRAMRRSFTFGQPRFTSAGMGRTDDRGMYRIAGLAPGDYVVVVPQTQTTVPVASMNAMMEGVLGGAGLGASMDLAAAGVMPTGAGIQVGGQLVSAASGALPVVGGDGRLAAHQTQYFPAAPIPDEATTLTLNSGDHRASVDIRMPLVATAAISGTVIGPDGPMANVPVRVSPAGAAPGHDPMADVARGASAADGSFQLYGVPAGSHVIKVLRVPRPPLPAAFASNPQMQALMGGRGGPPSPSDGLTLFANVPVSVEKDISDLQITLSAGASVSGRLEFVGSAAPPVMTAQTVTLQSLGEQAGRVMPTRVGEDGRFTVSGYPPGSYFFNSTGRAPGWFLKSAMVNGINALDQPFDLAAEDIANVVVTFVDRQSTLNGTVAGPTGAPVEATVLIFPAAHREWISRGMAARLMRTVRTQASGAFTIAGLPGRDYLVVALAEEDVPDPQDPAVYAALARIATTVTLSEDGARTVSLKLAQVAR